MHSDDQNTTIAYLKECNLRLGVEKKQAIYRYVDAEIQVKNLEEENKRLQKKIEFLNAR